jgi:hypothetical protein
MVQGIALRDRASKLKSIQTVEQITELDPLDVALRLDELAQLKPGWLNGKGHGFEKESLDRLILYFDRYYPDEHPLPHIYPTAEGSVLAEWTIGSWEISLEIDLNSIQGDYQAFNVLTDETIELLLDLSSKEGWSALGQQFNETERAQA